MFRHGLAVAIAPDLGGDFLEFGFGGGEVFQAGRRGGFWAEDGCAVLHELAEFAGDGQGHGPCVGQDEHAVAQAVGQNEAAVAHG